MGLLLPRSVYRSPFRFHRMWQMVQAHSHPPALGGRLRFQLKWSTVSGSMYIERGFADMSCMVSFATLSFFDDRPSRRIIPIMYLPKTWPSHPMPSRESIFSSLPSSSVYKTVSLHPELPTDVPPKAMAMMPTVEASFTNTCIYHYAHRTVVVLPIRRYIRLRSIHSSQTYYPEYGVSCSGTTAHPRAGSPIGKVHGSTDTKWSGC